MLIGEHGQAPRPALRSVADVQARDERLASRLPGVFDPGRGPDPQVPGASRWSSGEKLILAASILLLFAVAVRCGWGRVFWEDEMLGWMLLRDPSWKHMLSSWRQGADGGGITFYLLGRLWLKVFGTSVLAYRLFSTTCFAGAFVFSWSILRRFYTTGVTAFASLTIWLISPALVQHMTEGRFYGQLMLAVAAAAWMAVRCARSARLGWGTYAGVFLIHAVLVTTHQLGVVYSFFMIAAMASMDRMTERWRPRLYLVPMSSWLLLLPCLPAIKATARVGKPYFWTTQPSLHDFLLLYTAFTPTVALIVIATAGLALWGAGNWSTTPRRIREAFRARWPVYTIACSLFLVPILLFLEGLFGPALCTSRYLQPVAIATLCLLAELSTLALGSPRAKMLTGKPVALAFWTIFIAGLLLYDFAYRPRHTTLLDDYTATLTGELPKGVPVVCEDAFAFTELIGRQHDSGVKYTYLLDWQNSLSHRAPRLEVTQFHLMENWKKVGYFSGSIHYADRFLSENPTFYTLSVSDLAQPLFGGQKAVPRLPIIGSDLHARLADDQQYRVTLFKVLRLREISASVWKVCRREDPGCGQGP